MENDMKSVYEISPRVILKEKGFAIFLFKYSD
jgi:hypothetical protein